MTGGQRSVAFFLACWLATGCELTPFAETSLLACTDELDNDGDSYSDCSDSDCWALAHCRVALPDAGTPLVPGRPPEKPMSEPPIVMIPPSIMDAADPPYPDDASVVLDAAIPDADVDATLPPACEACPDGLCVDGVCAPSEPLGRFRVVNMRVIVPVSRELVALDSCFDTRAACNRLFGCCEPDPILTMRVDGRKVGSLTAENTADKTWATPGFEIDLRNGSKVEFELADDDSGDSGEASDPDPDFMYSCWTIANTDNVGARELACEPEQLLPSPIIGASVSVSARIVAIPAVAP